MDLAKRFDQAMFDIYRRADVEFGYRPTIFLNMLHERGGVQTAKALINVAKPSDGYTRSTKPTGSTSRSKPSSSTIPNGIRSSATKSWRRRGGD